MFVLAVTCNKRISSSINVDLLQQLSYVSFWLSLCKIVRSSVILLLPLSTYIPYMYIDFVDRWLLLTRKLRNQGFLAVKLKSSRRKFYRHHYELGTAAAEDPHLLKMIFFCYMWQLIQTFDIYYVIKVKYRVFRFHRMGYENKAILCNTVTR
jgi:hypothetical protein